MWQKGRQESYGEYYKLSLMPHRFSKWLKADIYLLKFTPKCVIPAHRDPAPVGYDHKRWNMVLKGEGVFTSYSYYGSMSSEMKPLDNVWFYANLLEHDFIAGEKGCIMLSIGKLEKK